MTRDELIEAGAAALVGGTNYHMSGDAGVAGTMNRLTATFVIDAVEPLIRANEREREDVRRDLSDLRSDRLEQRMLALYAGIEELRSEAEERRDIYDLESDDPDVRLSWMLWNSKIVAYWEVLALIEEGTDD